MPRKTGGIDWRSSDAKAMLIKDLEDGNLPEEWSAEEAWEYYSELGPFEFVPFNQFKDQLGKHRIAVKRDDSHVALASAAFDHDRKLLPQATHNRNGRPLFYLSDAKAKLSEDILANRHVGLDPEAFRRTRPEYMKWTLDEFRPRVYQQVRLQRWYNYMEDKRNEKEATRKKTCERERKAYEKKRADEVKVQAKKEADEAKKHAAKSNKKRKY